MKELIERLLALNHDPAENVQRAIMGALGVSPKQDTGDGKMYIQSIYIDQKIVLFWIEREESLDRCDLNLKEVSCRKPISQEASSGASTLYQNVDPRNITDLHSEKPDTPTSTEAMPEQPSSWRSRLLALLPLAHSSTEASSCGRSQELSQPSSVVWMKRLQQLLEERPHRLPCVVRTQQSGDVFVSFSKTKGGWRKMHSLTAPARIVERMTPDEFFDEITRSSLPQPD